nr:hypothetical protein [uncultured Carboxylicivirga sp.]
MIDTDIDLNRKRDFSDVINVTFSFIKQEFSLIFSSVAIYTIIPLLGTAILSVYYTNDSWSTYFKAIFNHSPVINPPNFTILFLMILVSVISRVMIMGITYEYLHLYTTKGRGNFTRSDVANAFAKDFVKILGYNIVVGIVVFFGVIFFVIPGIYLSVPLSFITVVLIVEKGSFSEVWNKCFSIIKNNWWLTFGLIIVMYFIISAMSMVFSIPITIYGAVKGIAVATGGNSDMDFGVLTVLSIISTLGSSWLYTMMYVMIGTHYYNLTSDKTQASTILDRINQIEERPVEDSF